MPDGRQEGARRGDGDGHQEGVRTDLEVTGDVDADGRGDKRRGDIVEHIGECHRDDHQDGQHHGYGQTPRPADDRLGDEGRAAGGFECRADRDQAAEQHDDRPFNRAVHLAQRHDPQQHIDDHHRGQSYRQVDQAEAGRQDGGGEDQHGHPGLLPLDHPDPTVGQRQAAQPIEDIRQPLGVAEKQQDVAGLDLQLAHPVAKPPALSRDAEQRHAVAVEQPHVER